MSGTSEGGGRNNFFKHRKCYTSKAPIKLDANRQFHVDTDGWYRVTFHKRRQILMRMIRRYAFTETPEARLWCAVLTRAVQDFGTSTHHAEFWINGSADTICEALNLSPENIHRWAKRLKLPLTKDVRRIPMARVP